MQFSLRKVCKLSIRIVYLQPKQKTKDTVLRKTWLINCFDGLRSTDDDLIV